MALVQLIGGRQRLSLFLHPCSLASLSQNRFHYLCSLYPGQPFVESLMTEAELFMWKNDLSSAQVDEIEYKFKALKPYLKG